MTEADHVHRFVFSHLTNTFYGTGTVLTSADAVVICPECGRIRVVEYLR